MIDAKRGLDVALSCVGLAVAAPVLAAAAVAVRMTSPGPVFFRQERVGWHGEIFKIHKFRTMRVGGGSFVSTTGDPRITRVGSVLRSTKLDELPQLLDVLAGDMSLVGPRPEVPRYVALWSPEDRETILSARPGITDPASIALRNEADRLGEQADPEAYYEQVLLPEKCAMYVDYVRTRSFRGDLAILLGTVRAVLRG